MRHNPLQRVLYGDDPVLGLAPLDLRKDLPYRRMWVQLHARPEGAPRRLVRKGRLRPASLFSEHGSRHKHLELRSCLSRQTLYSTFPGVTEVVAHRSLEEHGGR